MGVSRWAAITLLAATGFIHLSIGLGFGGEIGVLFDLMGVIYLVGVVILLTRFKERLFYTLSLIYTVILILVWAAAGARDQIAYVDKTIEVGAVIALVFLIRKQGKSNRSS